MTISTKLIALTTLTTVVGLGTTATAQLSTTTPFQVAQTAAAPRTSLATSSLQTMEQAVYSQINRYRAQRKLPPLTLNARISDQARAHSQAMASGRVPFSHNGFQDRVKAIARTIPYAAAAENVSYSQGYQDPATEAVKGWLKSPGHLKNIEGKYDLTGIGAARNAKGEVYLTQIFIRKK